MAVELRYFKRAVQNHSVNSISEIAEASAYAGSYPVAYDYTAVLVTFAFCGFSDRYPEGKCFSGTDYKTVQLFAGKSYIYSFILL